MENDSRPTHNLLSLSFRQKVAIIFTLLITFIMLLSVYLVTYQIKKNSLKRAQDTGRLLGRIIALSMGEDIIRENLQSINYVLKEFAKLEKIKYCFILDNYGRVIASTNDKFAGKFFSDAWTRSTLIAPGVMIRRAACNNKPIYDTAVPIEIGGNRQAIIRVGFTLSEELASIRSSLVYNLSLGLILIIGGIFIAYALSSTLLSPLNAILNLLEAMRCGDYSKKAYIKSDDEFEQLAKSFNKLSNFLEQRQETEKYISRRIWESDTNLKYHNYSGKVISAVVVHFELSRFSLFLEKYSPSEAVDTLNLFLTQTTEIVAESGGVIDKYGDGYITAVFPVNADDKWPAFIRAAFAALSNRNNLGILNFKLSQLGLEEVQLQIGMAYGKIIVGNIGNNIRNDFSVLGATVKQAKKAAKRCGRGNEFRPVSTLELVRISSDFLNYNKMEAKPEDKRDYFSLQNFANLAYFKERLKETAVKGSLNIIAVFGLTESEEGLDFIEEILQDEKQKQYHLEAIKALSANLFAGKERAKTILTKIIKSNPDAQLVAQAISVLGWSRNQDLIGLFVELFEHPDDRIRANAVEACIPLHFTEKRDLLKKMLKDSAPRVCGNALLGLWLADDKETLSCLYAMLKSDDYRKRAAGAFAIYFLAASRKFRRMFPAYSEDSSNNVLPIIENIIKRLKIMLESSEASERMQALRAASKIGFQDFGPAIKEMIAVEDEPEILSLAHSILKEWGFQTSENI